jgi:CNT family concentrative nucleoside transporter
MAIGLSRAIVPSDSAATRAPVKLDNPYRSGLDAIAHGTLFAAKMAANIAALLIVFVGLVALIDQLLALLPHADAPLTLATIFGHLLAPVAWLMGIPSTDLQTAGALLGTKIALNEIVAYGQLVALAPAALSDKGVLIMTYALSSFANIGSVAILIGTLTSMAPDKSVEIVQLGFKALLAALLATCLTGTTVGILSSLLIGSY